MTGQKKHRGVVLCSECRENLVGLFVFAPMGQTGLNKVDNFGYCHHCQKVFKTMIQEV